MRHLGKVLFSVATKIFIPLFEEDDALIIKGGHLITSEFPKDALGSDCVIEPYNWLQQVKKLFKKTWIGRLKVVKSR